jgi:Fe-S cluster assembly ATP-binding protein
MTDMLLKIRGLKVCVEDTEILHGIDLDINSGEIHAIMGPNGSGKSTLSSALMGHPKYEITEGTVMFRGKDLLEMDPEKRATLGLFLSFQYPKEIPGVNLVSFMRASYNAVRKAQALVSGDEFEPVTLFAFKKMMMDKMSLVGMPASFMERATNEGFSGGEKKKCEILQMAVLEPILAILDETDSGLDIDALKDICNTILEVRKPEQSILMITHYQRILDYIAPDHVHVMMDGKIVMSGGSDLARTIEAEGYDYVREKVGIKKESGFKMITS